MRFRTFRNWVLVGSLTGLIFLGIKGCNKIKEIRNDEPTKPTTDEQLSDELEFIKNECERVYQAVKTFNLATLEPSFRRIEDGNKYLFINWDQMMSVNTYMNINTNNIEEYEIFNEIDIDTINKDFEHVFNMLLMYNERATKPSGIALLIKDQASRELFEKYEQLNINYNKLSPEDRVEAAKKIIKELEDLVNNKPNVNPGVLRLVILSFVNRFDLSWRNSTVKFPSELKESLGKIDATTCFEAKILLEILSKKYTSMSKEELNRKEANYQFMRFKKIEHLLTIENLLTLKAHYNGISINTNLIESNSNYFKDGYNGKIYPDHSKTLTNQTVKKGQEKQISEEELKSEEVKKEAEKQEQEIVEGIYNSDFNVSEREYKEYLEKYYDIAYWDIGVPMYQDDPDISLSYLEYYICEVLYNRYVNESENHNRALKDALEQAYSALKEYIRDNRRIDKKIEEENKSGGQTEINEDYVDPNTGEFKIDGPLKDKDGNIIVPNPQANNLNKINYLAMIKNMLLQSPQKDDNLEIEKVKQIYIA